MGLDDKKESFSVIKRKHFGIINPTLSRQSGMFWYPPEHSVEYIVYNADNAYVLKDCGISFKNALLRGPLLDVDMLDGHPEIGRCNTGTHHLKTKLYSRVRLLGNTRQLCPQ